MLLLKNVILNDKKPQGSETKSKTKKPTPESPSSPDHFIHLEQSRHLRDYPACLIEALKGMGIADW